MLPGRERSSIAQAAAALLARSILLPPDATGIAMLPDRSITIESAAVIETVLSRDSRITGHYTYEEVSDMVVKLQSGALAAPMTPVEERVIGPSLGADSINKGIKAVIFGLVLVLVFMVVYYPAVSG